MRLRKKWWARPELEESNYFKSIDQAKELKGKWNEEFNNENDIYLELGCGRGGFTRENALRNPDKNFVAVDLLDNILVYTLRNVKEAELTNVRIIAMNIAFIADVFEKNEISKIFINFCNPWPKKRQKKRRLIHTRFLTEYKKFIKPNTEIWFKTDDLGLFEESFEYFEESGFEILCSTYDLHNSEYAEQNIPTEYESKFTQKGIKTKFLVARLSIAK